MKHSFVEAYAFLRQPEIVLILIFLPFLVIGRLVTGQFVYPSFHSSVFLFQHYVFPVIAAIAVMHLLLKRMDGRGAMLILSLCLFSLFVHFNFKSWALLIGRNYDAFYHGIDLGLGVSSAMIALRRRIMSAGCCGFVDYVYHGLFVLLFFVTMIFATIRGKLAVAREVNFAICLVLLVGGVSYTFFPAYGPFMFGQSVSPSILSVQHHMLSIAETIKKPAFSRLIFLSTDWRRCRASI
jgi:hypothetical protein